MQPQFLHDTTYVKRTTGQILRVNTENRLHRQHPASFFTCSRAAVVIVCTTQYVCTYMHTYVYEFWEFDGRRAKLLGTGFGFVLACNSGRS